MSRIYPLAFFLLLVFSLVSSCENTSCGCDPVPAYTANDLLYTWRLDEITTRNGTVSQNDIKDRYTLQFKADGTYQQTLLADQTSTLGKWQLVDGYTRLALTDHKGTTNSYLLMRLNATSLVYSSLNKDQELEQYVFSRQ